MKTDHPPIPPGQKMIRVEMIDKYVGDRTYHVYEGVVLRVGNQKITDETPEGRYVIACVACDIYQKRIDAPNSDWTRLMEDKIVWRAWGGLDK